MPIFTVYLSSEFSEKTDLKFVIEAVEKGAVESGLFSLQDIKVFVQSCLASSIGGDTKAFVHTIAYVMQGRDVETKKRLTDLISQSLEKVLPHAASITTDAREIETACYSKILPTSEQGRKTT